MAPLLVEVAALWFSIQLALRLGWDAVIFESDNLALINLLQAKRAGLTRVMVC